MARSKGDLVCHAHDSMVSYELHHVWPTALHGPDTKANIVKICPNAHSDVHHLMGLMLRGKPYNWREYGPTVRDLATRGYDQVMAYAETLSAAREGTSRG